MTKATITITYGEAVENHVGNQQIGVCLDKGISYSKLKTIKDNLIKDNYNCKIINLKKMLKSEYKLEAEEAGILVVKNFVNDFFKNKNKEEEIFKELVKLDWDKKALMRGRVVNKLARWNLCFADFSQNPEYEKGKGKVYDFKDLKFLEDMRKYIENLVGIKLNAEGNYYYDTKSTYIGFHGDSERRVVVGVRFGDDFPLYYQWYQNSEAITEPFEINLSGGDLYIMSEKAVGSDWKKKKILTLRHAAGFTVV